MKTPAELKINDHWIRSLRGPRNKVDFRKPSAFYVEKERAVNGEINTIATIFLTNKECPFQCLMCDLWKNTTPESVKAGDIPTQIEWALNRLPKANQVKLYNSGNFFDNKAILPLDYPAIASLVQEFDTVIVENHPKLINDLTFKFQKLLTPNLEIAMGLETVHPEVLKRLNKKMTLEDFEAAVYKLKKHDIPTRTFILLRPPFLSELEGIIWAKRSIDFAFKASVQSCVVIPTRFGNGALNQLGEMGYFSPPQIDSLEKVLEYGIGLGTGNVFADLWDIELFAKCSNCLSKRKERLTHMNLHQIILPKIICDCQDKLMVSASSAGPGT